MEIHSGDKVDIEIAAVERARRRQRVRRFRKLLVPGTAPSRSMSSLD
jgi:hypothetical protein